ncbi:MAG: hypothetical protein QOG67_3665 [Verrucomicrobiota bacterium]
MKRASRFLAIAPHSQVANDRIRGGDHGSPTLQIEEQSLRGTMLVERLRRERSVCLHRPDQGSKQGSGIEWGRIYIF